MSVLGRIAAFLLGRAAWAADETLPRRVLDDPFLRSSDLAIALLDDARRSNAPQPEECV